MPTTSSPTGSGAVLPAMIPHDLYIQQHAHQKEGLAGIWCRERLDSSWVQPLSQATKWELEECLAGGAPKPPLSSLILQRAATIQWLGKTERVYICPQIDLVDVPDPVLWEPGKKPPLPSHHAHQLVLCSS